MKCPLLADYTIALQKPMNFVTTINNELDAEF